jgi:hypothetical protein
VAGLRATERVATMSPAAKWHGEPAEWNDLWLAIEAHCDCAYDLLAVRAAICAAHLMLTRQATLDHLVHGRRLREWFVRNEFRAEWPCSCSAVASHAWVPAGSMREFECLDTITG